MLRASGRSIASVKGHFFPGQVASSWATEHQERIHVRSIGFFLQLVEIRAVEVLAAGLGLPVRVSLPLGANGGMGEVVGLPATGVGEDIIRLLNLAIASADSDLTRSIAKPEQ